MKHMKTPIKVDNHGLFPQAIGEFVLTDPNITMKPRGKPIYSVNEGNACLFDDAVTKYLESIKFPKVSISALFVTSFNELKLFFTFNSQ